MRRLLFIIGIVLIGGSLIWYFNSKKQSTTGKSQSQSTTKSGFPTGAPTVPSIDGALPQDQTDQSQQQATGGGASPIKGFTQISTSPVAGYTLASIKKTVILPIDPKKPKAKPLVQTTTNTVLRYVSQTNGYVYEAPKGESAIQISNVFIPGIQEALFGDMGSVALLRFLRNDAQTIASYVVPVPPENTDGTRTQKPGSYLVDNIRSIAVSPDGSQLARLTTSASGALVSTTTLQGLKKIDVIKTAFQEWLVSWPTQKSIFLQTKPSALVPGYLYRIDLSEKKLRRILGDINGLTTSVSPSGTYILYSQNSGDQFVTKLFNTKTNTTNTLSLRILPEKCAWLKNEDLLCAGNTSVASGSYPDDWYQGIRSFTDQLYRIYTTTVTYGTVFGGNGASFDMTNLQADELTSTLYFIDKNTGLLWSTNY